MRVILILESAFFLSLFLGKWSLQLTNKAIKKFLLGQKLAWSLIIFPFHSVYTETNVLCEYFLLFGVIS